MIVLGSKAKDVITGFTGIVTGRAQYLTGCDQYIIAQPATKEGVCPTCWFDENRLEVLKCKPVVIKATEDGKKGGPALDQAPSK